MITCLTEWRLKFTSQFLWKFSIEADQKFNSFLKEARDFIEAKGCKVVDNYKFRQVVDTFYEEAEFE